MGVHCCQSVVQKLLLEILLLLQQLKSNGKIDSVTTVLLGELLFDYLNEGPEVQFECWQVTTMGTRGISGKPSRFKTLAQRLKETGGITQPGQKLLLGLLKTTIEGAEDITLGSPDLLGRDQQAGIITGLEQIMKLFKDKLKTIKLIMKRYLKVNYQMI